MSEAAGCLILVLALPFTIAVRGWALASLWLWFVVPLGVPNISTVHAYGLSVLISLFGSSFAKPESTQVKSRESVIIGHLITAFATPMFAVGMGWIVKQWMS